MSELIDAARGLVNAKSTADRLELEHQFLERLTFSSAEQIVCMLDGLLAGEHWMELPVWARNLSFRLACLLQPDHAEIRRRAAADLLCFGPDWDKEAAQYEMEARRIEGAAR